MSTNQAQVSRILLIKSHQHLWSLLKDRDDLWCNTSQLIVFMYAFEKLINGCDCDKSKNLQNVEELYSSIKTDESVKESLKSIFSCTGIVFQ
jgi:hypothetical protein